LRYSQDVLSDRHSTEVRLLIDQALDRVAPRQRRQRAHARRGHSRRRMSERDGSRQRLPLDEGHGLRAGKGIT
jgi:hypothetical protein